MTILPRFLCLVHGHVQSIVSRRKSRGKQSRILAKMEHVRNIRLGTVYGLEEGDHVQDLHVSRDVYTGDIGLL